MKILITGGGGFLGSYISKKLIDEGHELTNFSRSSHSGLNCIRGNLKNYADLKDAIEGNEVVFHVASKVGMVGSWKSFYESNVIGTCNVIRACQECGVKKLIYTSTPSVVFGNSDLCGVDETTPYPKKFYSYYAKSKSMAEKEILEANGKNLLTVSLRPHLIFGPGDPNLVPRLVRAHKKGRLKIVGDGQNQADVLYVENGADAHIEAFKRLEEGSPLGGQAYFLGQGPIKIWEFTDKIMELNGLPPISSKISFKAAYAVGAILEGAIKLFRLTKFDPPMTRFVAMQLSMNHYYNHSKAERDLNFFPEISIEEGLKRIAQ